MVLPSSFCPPLNHNSCVSFLLRRKKVPHSLNRLQIRLSSCEHQRDDVSIFLVDAGNFSQALKFFEAHLQFLRHEAQQWAGGYGFSSCQTSSVLVSDV